MENKKDVICPVCCKRKFNSQDQFILCNHCGWEGSLDAKDEEEGLEGYTLRDYKKIYEEYIKQHPNYNWKEDVHAIDKYVTSFEDYGSICPICGEDSLEPDYRYCYKCGWRYNPIQNQFPNYDNSLNKLSLNQYKEQYQNYLKNNEDYSWNNTEEVKMPFTEQHIRWFKDNNISYDFDKLSLESEVWEIYNQIEEKELEAEKEKDYEAHTLIHDIQLIILKYI